MLNRTQPFQVVRWGDPAIDGDADVDWKQFADERDPSVLKFLPGKQPAVFHARVLTRAECREVQNQQTDLGKSTPRSRETAFRYGLLRVERMPVVDGSPRSWERPDDGTGAGATRLRPLSDDALELFGIPTIQEVGSVVEARSFLDPDQRLAVPLLDTSRLALQARTRPPAEQTSASSASHPSSLAPGASAAPEPRATEPASPSGAASGAATATASVEASRPT